MRHIILYSMAAALAWAADNKEQHNIDTQKSVMTVRVFKAGALSAFGHDHQIGAPIARGTVDRAAHRVDLRVNAKSLRVEDPHASEKDRAEIEKNMLGPEVLDTEKYPEIVFKSESAEQAAAGSWTLRGNLTLHGETRPVTVNVVEKDGRYTGHATFKQTEFGIKPAKAAGGTVRAKDEVRIEFNIQLMP
jgi:polyisoprenoid-binding protein YceI